VTQKIKHEIGQEDKVAIVYPGRMPLSSTRNISREIHTTSCFQLLCFGIILSSKARSRTNRRNTKACSAWKIFQSGTGFKFPLILRCQYQGSRTTPKQIPCW